MRRIALAMVMLGAAVGAADAGVLERAKSVSYTHLTLPTM